MWNICFEKYLPLLGSKDRALSGVLPPGEVYGKVKLWGKIIPGTMGSRAEFAYPSELHVPIELKDNPGILAYGVPVIAEEWEVTGGGFVVPSVLSGQHRLAAQTAMASSSFPSYPPLESSKKLKIPSYHEFVFVACFAAVIFNLVVIVIRALK